MFLQINKIKIPKNRRAVDNQKVKELAESIKQIGLINPITVKSEGGDFTLVAGLHRLEAQKSLGHPNIEVKTISNNGLETELIEIDENLIRNELHYTERGELLRRKKEIYEELYPETKNGGNRGNQYTGGRSRNPSSGEEKVNDVETESDIALIKTESDFMQQSTKKTESDFLETKPSNAEMESDVALTKTEFDLTPKPSFVTDTAQKTGRSETVIKEELQIANKIIPEAKEVLKTKEIPKTEAVKLAREEPEIQKKIILLFESGETKKVEEAKKIIDPIDEEYDKMAAERDAEHKRIKKVLNLLNYTQFLDITEQSIQEYMEAFPKSHNDFAERCEKAIGIYQEAIRSYNKLIQIRRVK